MSPKVKLLIVVMFLTLLGGGLAFYKSRVLGIPFFKGESVQEWQIEARVSFIATGKDVLVRLRLPESVMQQNSGREVGSMSYDFNIETSAGEAEDRNNYTAVWSAIDKQDNQALYFRVRMPTNDTTSGEPLTAPRPELHEPTLPSSVEKAAKLIVERATSLTNDPNALFATIFKQIYGEQTASQELLLVQRYFEKEHRNSWQAQMGITLLELANVPARLAHGVLLDDGLGAQSPLLLVEYYDGVYWQVRNPMEPSSVLDSRKVFVWHRGGGALLDEVLGGDNSRVSFTVERERIPLSVMTDLRDESIAVSTILGLPMAERASFRYIVLIPLGAFMVVLMRNIVGVPTLGTFMPVLIALALLEIPVVRGLIMFSVLITVGLWCRFLLSRLNLLVVPRVAACVVIVTLLMILMSVVSHRMGMSNGVQITLFPMIILAWTIERMSIIWEEEGKHNAIVQVAGSLFVSVLAYQLMSIGQIQYWAFYFPELLLVMLAGILLIGRYTGYRLTELVRFKTFSEA